MRAGRAHILELLRSLEPVCAQLERQRHEEGVLGEVRAQLPAAERPHCLRAHRQGAVLALTLDSAAWGVRLHYRIPQLLAALAGAGVSAIKIRIEPPGQGPGRRFPGPGSTLGRGVGLSPAVADHLLAAAEEIEEAGIAEAFRRLAHRRR
jgi:hypothetical protein